MTTSAHGSELFELEHDGDTVIVIPTVDMREFEYQRIQSGAKQVFELVESGSANNIVMDFSKTDYYGSTALGFFLKLWTRVTGRGGRMAFCNVSAHEKEILEITMLHRLWPICASRQEALERVSGSSGGP